MRSMEGKKIDLEIPAFLSKKLDKKVNESEFNTVSEYITYLLEQALSEEDVEENSDDEKSVKEKLKDLGYL